MNDNNLIKPEDLTPRERRESARKAGKASAAARRKKKSMREKMKMLLELPCSDQSDWNDAAAMGVECNDIDNETAMLIGLYKQAKSGNVQAVREIRNILGKDNSSEELALKKKELKLKEELLKPADNESSDDGFIEALNIKTEEVWNDK